MSVSVENKSLAEHASKAFGGSPRVQAYHHDTENLSIDVLRCDDRPGRGVTSYSTVGLSGTPMLKDDREFPTRLELAGACATTDKFFANVLASAAFCIMRTTGFYCPGSVMQGYVREYYPSTTVPHLYFTAPFLWEDTLHTLELRTRSVSWLLVVPISDAENDYLKGCGDEKLEDLFEENQIDIFNLARPSVL
jgi:antitoxin YqcF